ncbi:MAG: aminotransferase class III-fold pyridoxal phosphate-dependent enzyme, partial [Flavobacteriales bacterium]
ARGDQLFSGLQRLKEKHEIVGDVRGGEGLMCALELVSDRATKKPADKATAARIYDAAYESGTMVRISGPNIILSPPLVINASEVDQILMSLDHGLAQA